jgi:hypothetical protein
MTATSMALLVSLVVSLIANVALVGQLRASKLREEASRHERKW